uniref:MARVEL domain-containing protein n=1 Tax=Fusarium oxysporum (strain Fo5176) TaxID=660025 RepID=A0A0C4DJK7_FUSOF
MNFGELSTFVPSGYESYSYRLDPHDEVDDGYAAKAFRPVSDQQVLLRRRHVRNKRRETFDAVRLCLRIFILLLDLSILSLLIHGVNIWETTYTSVDRNEDGWTRTQWASVKMLSTWLMLVIAAFASFIQMVAIATHLSFPQSLRDGWVHTGAVLASSGITIAGWVAATVYLIIDKEVLRNSHWDLWSWSCQNRAQQSYISWASLCTEISYTFIAGLVVIVLEIIGLALFIISLRGVYIVGRYSRASTVY